MRPRATIRGRHRACSRSAAAPASTRRFSRRGARASSRAIRRRRWSADRCGGSRASGWTTAPASCHAASRISRRFSTRSAEPSGFDGIVSNFGALNCVEASRRSARSRGDTSARRTRRSRPDESRVRARSDLLHRDATSATSRDGGSGPAPWRSPWPASTCRRTTTASATFVRALGPDLALQSIEGVGVAIPPPYLEPRWQQLPRAFARGRPGRRVGWRRGRRSTASAITCCWSSPSEGIVMPDVLLGQAYYLRFDPKLWQAQQPFAPLGALYAASCLRAHGHSTSLFDAMLAAVRSGVGRGARPRAAAHCGDLRGQLQLPVEDVPVADAAGGACDDRGGAGPRLRRRRVRLRRDRSSGVIPRKPGQPP